jgi:hypothetical protein
MAPLDSGSAAGITVEGKKRKIHRKMYIHMPECKEFTLVRLVPLDPLMEPLMPLALADNFIYSKFTYNTQLNQRDPPMWTQTFSKTYPNLTSNSIWRLWADVNNWPQWHEGLESCHMEGAFEVGNHFMLKPNGMKAVKIVLTEVTPGKCFTDCTAFPGAKMYDTHTLVQTPQGLTIANEVKVTGPLKWLWVKLVARRVADSIPQKVDALVKIAQNHG